MGPAVACRRNIAILLAGNCLVYYVPRKGKFLYLIFGIMICHAHCELNGLLFYA